MKQKIPVILDTDIGTDIDDTWALAFLLKCPELDLKMVLTDTGDTFYRAKLVAKLLHIANRTDVAIGIGISFDDNQRFMEDWVSNYKLENYPGKIYKDGIVAFIESVMSQKEKTTLICISAMPNIAAALQKEQRLSKKINFVGMHGSIYRGYNGKKTPDAESNVKYHNEACRKVFSLLKNIKITPLDTCGTIRLKGSIYKKLLNHSNPVLNAVIENYRLWSKNVSWTVDCNPDNNTSVLFDTAAICLAFTEKYFKMKNIKIKITEDGMTVPDKNGIPVRVALGWKNKHGFYKMLVSRLIHK